MTFNHNGFCFLVDTALINNLKAIGLPAIFGPAWRHLRKIYRRTWRWMIIFLVKTRRAVFVEGKDFSILAAFARKLGKNAIANRADFAVLPAEGFDPKKVSNMSEGMELTLGTKLLKAVIFDRDYRSIDEVTDVANQLSKCSNLTHIHERKEIENYLLDPAAIDRALAARIAEYNKRAGEKIICNEKSEAILETLTSELKTKINSQFLAKRSQAEKIKNPALDQATINQRLLEEFEKIWGNLSQRLEIVPGKEILSKLNIHFQERYKVSLTAASIIYAMSLQEIPKEIRVLIDKLDTFRTQLPQ